MGRKNKKKKEKKAVSNDRNAGPEPALADLIADGLGGADVNQATQDGTTPLFMAAQKGHLEVVRALVTELGADVNQATQDGATPLLIAAGKGHLKVVRALVTELGADVNQAAQNGVTPLLIAAQEGHLEAVRALVMELGADVNQATQDGTTPLLLLVLRGARIETRRAKELGVRLMDVERVASERGGGSRNKSDASPCQSCGVQGSKHGQ
jgi:ankyrin repeat protein